MRKIYALTTLLLLFAENETGVFAQNKAPQAGEMAPDFTLATPLGDSISLSDYRGKYVLIDFWASWCRDCRKENPAVVELNRKYAGDKFAIIGVSMDKDKEAWLKAIEKDGLTWTQVSELKGWQSVPAPAYEIKWIPTNFLIGPDGKVITTGKDLTNATAALKEIFGE
ncbi:MAG: TlpA family protein disulfide reductase [Muribaculaceae bacterium]|nr:TlpA family protein disulfide reductase [Muribaculaceae bacterium]